jgi:hypothetical protein
LDTRDLRAWALVSALLGLALVAAGLTLEVPPGTNWLLVAGLGLGGAALGGMAARRKLLALLGEDVSEDAQSRGARHPYATLFLASFVALFVEVMLIRYTGSQIRIFSFYKNVPLVASYLGLGLGCALAGGRGRHALAFLMWLLPLTVFLSIGSLAAQDWLGAFAAGASSEHILGDVAAEPTAGQIAASQAFMAAFCVATLVSITLLFALLGRLLGDAFERVPRLPAYTTNILGSLAGILLFVGLSYFESPPWVWFPIGLLALCWWLQRPAQRALGLALVALISLTVVPAFGDTVWSRYQKLVGHHIPPGPEGTGSSSPGYMVEISDVFYQVAVDLRPRPSQSSDATPSPTTTAPCRCCRPPRTC